jgi:internalin A
MPEQSSTGTWRRRLRISVRGLMALVLLVGGGLGWVTHRAHVQRDAVAAIRRAGGEATYSWQWSNCVPASPLSKPPWSDWVRRTLGPDFIDTVTFVRLTGAQCGDDSLRAACRLPWLEELTVLNTSATDDAAEDIRYLTNLHLLDLRLNAGITRRTLRHIGALRELGTLTLSFRLFDIPASDEDMAFLRRLSNLERLNLYTANLDDGWLVYLEGLTNLKSLYLTENSMTAEGLDHLKGLSSLTAILNLHGTAFTLTGSNMTKAELAERVQMLSRIRLIRGK